MAQRSDAVPVPLLLRLDLPANADVRFTMNAARSVHGALHQTLGGRDAALARRVHDSHSAFFSTAPPLLAATLLPRSYTLRRIGFVGGFFGCGVKMTRWGRRRVGNTQLG
ncbi:MAG: hypothetical protein H0W06_08750 [Chloroflexia bacterium]|nr:hypothetical protein [Chloroflexia bacterium]